MSCQQIIRWCWSFCIRYLWQGWSVPLVSKSWCKLGNAELHVSFCLWLSQLSTKFQISEKLWPCRAVLLIYTVHSKLISMTSLLMHTVAHSTRPSYRPKINNQLLKKFLSLVCSLVKVKNWKILTFKVNFRCQKLSKSF